MRTLNLKQGCLLLLIVTFAFSCKQVKYQEFGSFGGGKFSSNKSAATDNKKATTVNLNSKQTVEIKDYNLPINATNTEIAGVNDWRRNLAFGSVGFIGILISIH